MRPDQEEALVSRCLTTLAETAAPPRGLPDPMTLWWKGQLLKRWAAEERAVRPLGLLQRILHGLAIAIPVAGAYWIGPALRTLSIPPSPLQPIGGPLVTVVALVVGAAGLGALFTLQLLLSEE